ncbi:cytochrome P450 [Actinoplanes sp. NPDC051633]|uniref:cytochrome P450 n=1 Tax=Actinoplanes sp. NPDC051633 TaxID=3155670 RepID=UPI00341A1038
MVTTTRPLDLADPGFWRLPEEERLAAFRALRELEHPVRFGDAVNGFHALVRHRDVVEASRNPKIFTSGTGVTTPRPPRWVRTVFGDSMVNLDDPRHGRLRAVVSKAFTPRVVGRIASDVERLATAIADDVLATRPSDFVSAVAGRMPFEVICDMMGIPASYRPEVLAQVDHSTERTGGRFRVPGKNLRALARLQHVVGKVARERRREPADDLISALANAGLNARELGSFFSLLLVAGVETTRNTIAHGLHLLTVNEAQRELLTNDFDRHAAGFVDEVVRFSSPIIQFRRTVSEDYELGGHPLRAGDDVVLFYTSANRDEAVFDAPDSFDITRKPNPHVGFGGGGPHFCLGTSLAKQEITVLFRELLTRMPGIRSAGAPVLAPSSFDNRIARLQFTF